MRLLDYLRLRLLRPKPRFTGVAPPRRPKSYIGPKPRQVHVQSYMCNDCVAVAVANALRSVYPDWRPKVRETFIHHGGTCLAGVEISTFLSFGSFYGENYDVLFKYRIAGQLEFERLLTQRWLGIVTVKAFPSFLMHRKGTYRPFSFELRMWGIVPEHAVYVYGYDEKTYHVINAYPNWGENYEGKLVKWAVTGYYLLKPVSPEPSWPCRGDNG